MITDKPVNFTVDTLETGNSGITNTCTAQALALLMDTGVSNGPIHWEH
jgi:hypothetical protein